ncbi:SCO7613 C-terminal domain-containing membrane protein [Agromyces aerolatus]|uniref:SCO7613 C-terminal domain-containing membrane protein n=1 Tax=Agromyces sp. LY-1074 TaxID=3074080 RepID=UPI00285AD6C5|nr:MULTISPECIES: hypothetical protein [unclassified Agromyces]MDR5699849.1 hypothetical protein [Agromyces sp. LY-1074]MDR5706339.1 hypothetical protein [Agromyces sp. LY-1358]
MTHTPERSARPAGLRRWPADPALLADTSRCPGCLTPLAAAVCTACGLDLSAPRAAEVLASGQRIVAEERRRQGLLDAMFAAQAAREASPMIAVVPPVVAVIPAEIEVPATGSPTAAVPPAAAAAASDPRVALAPPPGLPVTPPIMSPVAPPHGQPQAPPSVPGQGPSQGSPAAAEVAGRPKRSGMQVFLLTLGVVLISVTAIVFLFVAYLIASLEVRSVIIALASVLVLGVAALLRRRRLPGTAEGVAVVAVVLMLLDVWIVRANDLFGTGAAKPTAYAGVALLVLAAALGALRAATSIRTLGISAAVLAPVALFLLGVAAAPTGEPATAAWLGGLFAGIAAVGAAVVRVPGVERHLALALGVAGGGIAWCTAAFALPELAWHPLVTFGAVAVLWSAVLAALATRGRELGVAWQWVAAVMVGSALAAGPTVAIVVELDTMPAAWLAPMIASAIAVVLVVAFRLTTSISRRASLGAFVGASVIAVVAALPGMSAGVLVIGRVLLGVRGNWLGGQEAWFELPGELTTSAVIVPLMLAVASGLSAGMTGRLRTIGVVPVSFVGFGLLVAAAALDDLRWTAAALLAIAGSGLAIGSVVRRIPIRGLLPVVAVFGPLAAAIAWVSGYSSTEVWAWSTAGALVLTFAGWVLAPRIWRSRASSAATVHALLVALQLVVLGLAIAPWLSAVGVPLTADWAAPTVWAALITAALFGAAAAVRLPQSTWLALTAPLLAASTIAVASLFLTGESVFRWLCALVLAIAGAAWTWRGRLIVIAPASAAIAPVMVGVAAAWVTGDAFGAGDQADAAAAAALLVAAALAHVVTRRGDRLDRAVRVAWVAGTGALSVIVAGSAVLAGDWLPLALLVPVPVVLAALWGEPFASTSAARHLAWASPVLAVVSWWIWLVGEDATLVELFTLPVAALCILLGALIAVRRPLDASRSGRLTLIATGLGIAVVPSVAAAGDSAARALVLLSAGAVVLLSTAFAPHTLRGIPIGVLGVSSGAVAAVGGAAVHSGTIAVESGSLTAEWWSLAAFVVGVVASVWWARAGRTPARIADWLYSATIAAATLPTILAIVAAVPSGFAAIGGGLHAEIRAVVLLPLLAVLHVLAASNALRPLAGPIPRWTTLALLLVAAIAGLAARVEPFDLMTASVGLALIGAGVCDLRRRRSLGSWPALGPGLAVLLVPPLLADLFDPQLWRLVVLGVGALATLLAGIRSRLQAPFVLGGVVLLVHAVAQLWPWLTWLYEAVWWWIWLGIAGVLLVVIAATYERQLRTARAAVTRLAALR